MVTTTICRLGVLIGLAAGHGGHDADLVAIGQCCGLVVEKANVFAVDVDVEKTAQLAVLVTQAALEPGVARIERIDEGIDAAGLKRNAGLVVGELLQGGGNQNLDGDGVVWIGGGVMGKGPGQDAAWALWACCQAAWKLSSWASIR